MAKTISNCFILQIFRREVILNYLKIDILNSGINGDKEFLYIYLTWDIFWLKVYIECENAMLNILTCVTASYLSLNVDLAPVIDCARSRYRDLLGKTQAVFTTLLETSAWPPAGQMAIWWPCARTGIKTSFFVISDRNDEKFPDWTNVWYRIPRNDTIYGKVSFSL